MMDREEEEAARRWTAAERVAAGLPSETGPSRNRRRAWTIIVLAVLIGVALSFAVALLLPQSLLGDAVAVPNWLRTTGIIVECVGIVLGIVLWVHASRRGERPISQSLVVAPLSLTQRRRVANQIKGREPVHPEEMTVVRAAAGQAIVAQRFSLRLLPAYFLFALGNLMWTDWVPAKVLYVITLILFVLAIPIALQKMQRTKDFLQSADPGASKAPR